MVVKQYEYKVVDLAIVAECFNNAESAVLIFLALHFYLSVGMSEQTVKRSSYFEKVQHVLNSMSFHTQL